MLFAMHASADLANLLSFMTKALISTDHARSRHEHAHNLYSDSVIHTTANTFIDKCYSTLVALRITWPAAIWLDLNPSNVGLVCTDLHADFAAV